LLDRPAGYTVVVEDEARCAVDERLRERLIAIGPSSRLELLRVLNRPDAQPRTLIGALYPGAGFRMLSDVLIDLEADLPTLEAVVAELRAMVRDDHEREAFGNVTVMDPNAASDDDWMAGEFDTA
jgi:hypothetical protein